ncbi:MAG: hypothetical protein AB2812_05785 [Candidatus Sedimenticola endophacoides]
MTAVAFETVQEGERLPLLAPMSDIAGRLAIQIGTTLLHRPQGGKGLLLGGLPAAERGRVVVLGAGNAGGNAARMAAALGAQVVVFDKKPAALERMRALGENVTALYPYTAEVTREVARADLVVGAVLIPGASAPRVLDAGQVAAMAEGGVVVDIAVDQGGCIETTRPTTYEAPTYLGWAALPTSASPTCRGRGSTWSGAGWCTRGWGGEDLYRFKFNCSGGEDIIIHLIYSCR